MAFDPDAYLAQAEFDPDAYLAEEPPEEESYFKRVGSKFDQASETIAGVATDFRERGNLTGKPTPEDVKDVLEIGGEIVEAGFSLFGEAYNEIPKEYRKKIERVYGEGAKTLYNAVNIGGGLDTAVKILTDLAEENPDEAAALQDIAQIAGAAKLTKGAMRLGSGVSVHKWDEVVTPAASKSELKRRALNSKATVLGTDKPVTADWQKDMIKTLKGVDGVHPAHRNQVNANAVISAIGEKSKKLQKRLSSSKVKIDKKKIATKLQQDLYDEYNTNPVFDGFSQKEIERVTKRAMRFIDEAGDSPNDIWLARRKLDKFYEFHKGERFVSGSTNASQASEAYRIARNSLNEALEQNVPGAAPALKNLRTLYSARDILIDKAIMDDPTLPGRIMDKVGKIVTLRPPVVRGGYYGPSNLPKQ